MKVATLFSLLSRSSQETLALQTRYCSEVAFLVCTQETFSRRLDETEQQNDGVIGLNCSTGLGSVQMDSGAYFEFRRRNTRAGEGQKRKHKGRRSLTGVCFQMDPSPV